MRWSIEELIYSWSMYKEYNLYGFFRHFLHNRKRRFKLFFHWLFKGYTKESLWNLDTFLEEGFIHKLRQYRKVELMGYPYNLNSQEEWYEILDIMIDSWQKMHDEFYLNQIDWDSKKDMDELVQKQWDNDTKAMELFTKYFHALWD